MFIKYFIYLISLIPLFFITGPFLSGLGAVLISLYGLYSLKFFSNIEFHKSLKIFIILSLLFYFYTLLSSYNSPLPKESFKASLFYFRFILFTLGIYFLLNTNFKFSLKSIYKILFLCFVLVCSSVFYEYLYILFFKENSTSQYTGIFFEEKIAGSYISRLYPLLISLIIYFEEDIIKLKYINFKNYILTVFIFSFLTIFLSGERSSIAIFIISNIFLILGIKIYKEIIINRYLISGIIIFLFLFNALANDTFNRVFFKTYDQLFEDNKINLLSDHHEAHFFTAFKMFEENKLMGIGPRGFREFCNNDKYKFIYKSEVQLNNDSSPKRIGNNQIFIKDYDGCSTHPHNLFIQILSETGLIGILFYLIFLFWIYFELIRSLFLNKLKVDIVAFCALASICSSFFPILPSHNFFASYINILNFFILSFYFLKK